MPGISKLLKFVIRAFKFSIYCCFYIVHIPLGWILDKMPSFKKSRIERLAVFRSGNPHVEIRKKSELWYHLNWVYIRYLQYKYRKLPQEQYQQKRWDNYAEIYYTRRSYEPLLPKFDEFFGDAINNYTVSTVLDIGCGGCNIEAI